MKKPKCIRDEKELDGVFERFGGKIIKRIDGRNVSVNWDSYKKFPIGEDHFKINKLLEALGVFSSESSGNYEVVTHDGRILNPQSSFANDSQLFFKKIEDAIDFVQIVLFPVIENYPWEIRKISKVLNHTDFYPSRNKAA